MTLHNPLGKKPETTWPLKVYLVMQDGNGVAIDSPEDLRSDLYGVVREAPALGDLVPMRFGDNFEEWRVVGRRWMHLFPADGQMTPCSALEVYIVKQEAS